MQYIDGFASKLHISYFPETDFIAPLDIDITVLHYVSKPYTNRRIKNLF